MYTKIAETEEYLIYRNDLVSIEHKLIPIWTIENDRYLAFSNIMNMTASRLMVFQQIQELEKIGITKTEIINKLKSIKEYCKEGDTHSAYSLADYIEENMKDHWDISKTFRAIIPLCIIKESEIQLMGSYDKELCENNMKEIEANPQMLEFFFYIVQKFIENSQESALNSSQDYLTQIMKVKVANRNISKQDLTKESTPIKNLTTSFLQSLETLKTKIIS